MKTKTTFIFAFLCCLLVSVCSYAQDGGTLAERYHSKKAQRLALRLTKNKSTDEEKVDAIFNWIANHMKYDVKAFLKGESDEMSTNKILRKRKGVCTAYTQLFAELCYHAGIEAIEIEGYTKNTFLDNDEKFYYSDHIWNAVKLNGEWKPVDMTWCSGGIAFLKQNLFQKFLMIVTNGRINRSKFKPHFIKHVTKDYYLTKPNVFCIDHLAQNPDLQLRPEKLSIEGFERDSTPYFLSCGTDTSLFNRINSDTRAQDASSNFSIEEYYTRNLHQQVVINGDKGNNYNIKNSYCKAVSELTSAITKYNQLIKSKEFTEADLKPIGEITESCNTAIAHTVCHTGELEQQKRQRDATNVLKNKIETEQVKQALDRVNPVRKNFKQCSEKYKSTCKSTGKYLRKINKRQKTLANGKSFNKANPAKENNKKAISITSENDKAFDVYKQLSDSVDLRKQEFAQLINAFNNCSSRDQKITTLYSGQLKNSRVLLQQIAGLQFSYSDALDCDMKAAKKEYFGIKVQTDSLLLRDTVFFAHALPGKLRNLRAAYDKVQKAESAQYTELVKLKKKSYENYYVEKKYSDWLTEIDTTHNNYIKLVNEQKTALRIFAKNYKKCAKGTKKEIKQLKEERWFENYMFRFRKKFIKNHHKARKAANSDLKRTAVQITKYSDKIKKQIEKESKKK